LHSTKIIFIGGCSQTKSGHGGETIKNIYFIEYLKKLGKEVQVLDTVRMKQNPFLMFSLIWILAFRKSDLVISAATHTALSLFKIIWFLGWGKNEVRYFVIGGTIGDRVKAGEINPDILRRISQIYVETTQLENSLKESGLQNVSRLPNFKPIAGKIKVASASKQVSFKLVYVSRVIESKGIFVLIEVVKQLREKHTLQLDIYGPVGAEVKERFMNAIQREAAIQYNGILDFYGDSGAYAKLSEYQLMVLPTSHYGEGFPGVFIDCFIAGVPVLTTDWNSNSDIIRDGYNGFLITDARPEILYKKISSLLESPPDWRQYQENCRVNARQYDIDFVLNPIFV
jgi:glycosyltransferase involved in cell wall biosynthesis